VHRDSERGNQERRRKQRAKQQPSRVSARSRDCKAAAAGNAAKISNTPAGQSLGGRQARGVSSRGVQLTMK